MHLRKRDRLTANLLARYTFPSGGQRLLLDATGVCYRVRSARASRETLLGSYSLDDSCCKQAFAPTAWSGWVFGFAGDPEVIPSQELPTIRELSRFASIWNSTLRLPNDGHFTRGAEAGRTWTWGCTCQVSREVSAGSGSDRNRA